ncbi:cyanophycinase [Rossellomorea vietnamensis]|uniref:Cyanophycinase n=1 Tax=Rossellomorea vietnamensis TaxID=218284 RepID=A0A5D4MDV1_9BACI|nr:cyanophycinase [Rossellomorea vietnamensis]TYR99796.1 cyanophycinase [Rossellomorea vietnamensis]
MSAGELLIIGGNEEKYEGLSILQTFADLAMKRGGKVGILPAASRVPDEISSIYKDTFTKLGIHDSITLSISSREKADSLELNDSLEKISALFITGGNQSLLAERISGTTFHDSLLRRWKEGMILAGTSAGASIMGKEMIVSSKLKLHDDTLKVYMGKGFGFLEDLIIDQHFSQRGRFGRLIGAMAEMPGMIGIGIDENTAILLKDNEFEVIGEHQVFIVDGQEGEVFRPDVPEESSELTATNFKLHTLKAGFRFNLINKSVIHSK